MGKIHSIIISVTCHGLRNFPLLIHIPSYSYCGFSKSYELLFFELESLVKCWIWIGKNSLNNFICHLSWLEELPPTHTHPLISISWIFKILWVIIFWVRVTRKMLNLNWEKIHSIILSVTCHGLRNFLVLIHIPSYPYLEFSKSYKLLFFELESLIKCWIWIGKNSLNNYICHLSWLEKLSPTHTHPLISISWIFEILWVIIFYLSLVMAWETFPYSYTSPCIHIMNFWNPMSYYFLS